MGRAQGVGCEIGWVFLVWSGKGQKREGGARWAPTPTPQQRDGFVVAWMEEKTGERVRA